MSLIKYTLMLSVVCGLCRAEMTMSDHKEKNVETPTGNVTTEKIENTLWCAINRESSGETEMQTYQFMSNGNAFIMWVWLPPSDIGTTNAATMLGAYAIDVGYSISNGYLNVSKNSLNVFFDIQNDQLICTDDSMTSAEIVKLKTGCAEHSPSRQGKAPTKNEQESTALNSETLENTLWCGFQKKTGGIDLLRVFEFLPNGKVSIIWQWLPQAETREPNGANILSAYAVSATYCIAENEVIIHSYEGDFILAYEKSLFIGEAEKKLAGVYTRVGFSRTKDDKRIPAALHLPAVFKRLNIQDRSLSIGEEGAE